MVDMAAKRLGLGRERVRSELGLAVWQVELAVSSGLLIRLPDASFDPDVHAAALADPERFAAALDGATPLNLTEGARRLGVSVERLRRVIQAAGLEPHSSEAFRYGTVRRWLAGDLDGLGGHLAVDDAERHVAAAARRPAAAKKAAVTRSANREAGRTARGRIAEVLEDLGSCPVALVRFHAALSLARRTREGAFARFHADADVAAIAELIRVAHFPAVELERIWYDRLDEACSAVALLVDTTTTSEVLGVGQAVWGQHLGPSVGGHVRRAALDDLVAAPPDWLAAARRAEAESAALQDAARTVADEVRRAKADAKQAIRAAELELRRPLPSSTAGELLGIDPDDAAVLAPRRGWTASGIFEMARNPPAWVADRQAAHDAARQRLAERAARVAAKARRKTAAKARKAARTLTYWHRLGDAFAITLSEAQEVWPVPPNPTPASVAAFKRNPPKQLREVLARRAGGDAGSAAGVLPST